MRQLLLSFIISIVPLFEVLAQTFVIGNDTFVVVNEQDISPAKILVNLDSLVVLSPEDTTFLFGFNDIFTFSMLVIEGEIEDSRHPDTFLLYRDIGIEVLFRSLTVLTASQDSQYLFNTPTYNRLFDLNSDSTHLQKRADKLKVFLKEMPIYQLREECNETIIEYIDEYYSGFYYDFYSLEDSIDEHLLLPLPIQEVYVNTYFEILKNKQ